MIIHFDVCEKTRAREIWLEEIAGNLLGRVSANAVRILARSLRRGSGIEVTFGLPFVKSVWFEQGLSRCNFP